MDQEINYETNKEYPVKLKNTKMNFKLTKPINNKYILFFCLCLFASNVVIALFRVVPENILADPIPFVILIIAGIAILLSSNPIITFAESNLITMADYSASFYIDITYALILLLIAYGAYTRSKKLLNFGLYFFIFNVILSIFAIILQASNVIQEPVINPFVNIGLMMIGSYLIIRLKNTVDSNTTDSKREIEIKPTDDDESAKKTKNREEEANNNIGQNKVPIFSLINDLTLQQKKLITALGSILIIIGAFLPWISVSIFNINRRGIDGDGMFTFIGGLVILFLLGFTLWGRKSKLVSFLIGLACLSISLIYIIDPFFGVQVPEEDITRGVISIGIGLYTTFIGGLFVLISTFEEVYK